MGQTISTSKHKKTVIGWKCFYGLQKKVLARETGRQERVSKSIEIGKKFSLLQRGSQNGS